jgi:hypothetical protein
MVQPVSTVDIHERSNGYDQPHCWQYEIRQQNTETDLADAIRYFAQPRSLFAPIREINADTLQALRVPDFTLAFEEKSSCYDEVSEFIRRHEWLGQMSSRPTHIFTARYHGLLCGVVVMDMPNAFSKILGEGTRKVERLIARGACISFSPKNLGSALVMFSIRWMVQNTRFRLFTAYSDPEAKELGTIYQACNFYYLGKSSGTKYQYRLESGKWVSDRYFRCRSVYKRLALQAGISWDAAWQKGDKVHFDLMPETVSAQLRDLSKAYMLGRERREVDAKHKYAYVLGVNKRETKVLQAALLANTAIYPYPKERGA